MFCKNCGTELADGVKFCSKCGAEIDDSTDKLTAEVETSSDIIQPIDNAKISTNPNAIVLQSSAPISSKTAWTRWAYIISILLVYVKVGVVLFILTFIIDHFIMKFHNGKMRDMRFKFLSPVSSDEIFNRLQPALNQKYGNKISFDREGETVSVEFDSVIYDINLQDDGTFCVWWRRSFANSLFSWNEWKLYKKIRTGTALVAYELQHAFGIV